MRSGPGRALTLCAALAGAALPGAALARDAVARDAVVADPPAGDAAAHEAGAHDAAAREAGAVSGRAATHLGSLAWTLDDPAFGGMSALDVAPDGIGFVALSDRGAILSGALRRDAAGRIVAIEAGPLQRLRGRDDLPLPEPRSDAEGLAVAPDGTLFVSFETAPRVLRYDRLDAPAEVLRIPRDFDRMRTNGALEALAIGPDGALYTLPEEPFRRGIAFPVYRLRGETWDIPFSVQPIGDFLAVGADVGPDGRFYLLERSLGLRGFATRVRRFDLGSTGTVAGEVLLETAPGTHGNLEGLAVWRDAAGGLRLTMIADNNFHAFLTTEVVEYAVPD